MSSRFKPIVLELVRPGPSRNQLLSPLTYYMALCGDGSPVTMNIEVEHQQLLDRLEQTRYFTRDGPSSVKEIPDRLRESAVRELGEEVAKILKQTPSLLSELGRIRGGEECGGEAAFVHLRLRLGGSELSLLPFELALSPQAYPGEGLELCLQSTLRIGLYPDFPKSTNTLYLYILRAKLSVRPAQVDGIYVNIISHGSTPARTRACSDTTPRPDALYRALSRLDAVSDQAHVNVTHCQI